MKQTISLGLLCFCSLVIAQNKLEPLFFDLHLESSRDSVYNHIKKLEFIEYGKKSRITKIGKEIKTYSGFLNEFKTKQIDKKADTIAIQLTTGSISKAGENTYHNLLIVSVYYHFSNKQYASKFFLRKKTQIDSITNKRSYHYENSFENFDETIEKNGYSEKWFDLYDNHTDIDITLEKTKKMITQLH